MTRQEAEKRLKELETAINEDEGKGYQANTNRIIAAVQLQMGLRNGIFEDEPKKQKSDNIVTTVPKKRGRPKGAKNRKKA